MELRYRIPEHLEGFVGDWNESQLSSLVTVLLEYAVQHRLIDYPRTEIEDSVSEIRQTVMDIKSKQSLESSIMLQMMSNVNAQLTTLTYQLAGGKDMLPQVQVPMFAQPMYAQVAATTEEPEIKSKPLVYDKEEDIDVDANSEFGSGDDDVMAEFEAGLFK